MLLLLSIELHFEQSAMKNNAQQYLLLDDVMDLVTAEDKIIVRSHLVPKLLALDMVPIYGKPQNKTKHVIDFDYNLPKATMDKVRQDLLAYTSESCLQWVKEQVHERSCSKGSTLDVVVQDLMEGMPGSWPQEAEEEEIDERSSAEGSILDNVVQDLMESMPGSWPEEGIVDVTKDSGLEGLTRDETETETIRAHTRHIPGSWPEETREDLRNW